MHRAARNLSQLAGFMFLFAPDEKPSKLSGATLTIPTFCPSELPPTTLVVP